MILNYKEKIFLSKSFLFINKSRAEMEGGRRPPKLFFRLGGRAHHGATEKNKKS
jgi:hypothetical protein